MTSFKHPIKVLGLGCATEAGELPHLEAYTAFLLESEVICGGKAQLEMVSKLLPPAAPAGASPVAAVAFPTHTAGALSANASKGPFPILLTVDAKIPALMERLKELHDQGKKIAVLASGDPLYFGIGSTLAKHFAAEELRIYPAPASMQEACARLALPWHELRHVSLHGGKADAGRNLSALGRAALSERPLCLLIDPQTSPAAIAEYLLERGRGGYRLHYFGNLRALASDSPNHGAPGPEKQPPPEMHISMDLPTAVNELQNPSTTTGLIILVPEKSTATQNTRHRPFLGMPDDLFEHSAGLITKQPVRAAVLAALRLEPENTLFDLGAGCGSVGLEACALLPDGQVFSVEKKPERVAQILANRRKFGASNLEVLQGDALKLLELSAQLNAPGVATAAIAKAGKAFAPSSDSPLNASSVACTGEVVCPEAACRDETAGQDESVGHSRASRAMLPRADRVFIGGGLASGERASDAGGRALLAAAWENLRPGGRLVLSCVLLGSLRLALEFFVALGLEPEISTIQASQGVPLAGDIQLKAMNQVFIMAAQKKF